MSHAGRGRPDVVVVGAGVTGLILASRLAASGMSVALVEAGSAVEHPASRSTSMFDALAEPSLATTVEVVSGGRRRDYLTGRGIGGGAAINGMVWSNPDPADFDRWAHDAKLPAWTWSEVREAAERVQVQPSTAASSEWGVVDRMVVDGATRLGWTPGVVDGVGDGVGPVALARRSLPSSSFVAAYHRLSGHRPRVVGHSSVVRIVANGARVTGVELADGSVLSCGEVILCAGALASPMLVGGLLPAPPTVTTVQDHPSVRIELGGVDVQPQGGLVTATGLIGTCAHGRFQLLALNVGGPGRRPGLVVTALTIASRGHWHPGPGNAAGPDLGGLTDASDRALLRHAVAVGLDVIAAAGGRVENGPPSRDEGAIDAWIAARHGDTFHVCATLPMGGATTDPVDDRGRVRGMEGLRVADASVLPGVPSVNPLGTLATMAEHMSALIVAEA